VSATRPVLFVCSLGGHLDELVRLAPRIRPPGSPQQWVTFESAQSRERLAGREVEYVPAIEPKDLAGALRALPGAHRLLGRLRPSRVITTGAAVAVPYALAARARGIGFHYIETCGRVTAPSLTGRMLARVPGTRTYTQQERWSTPRWPYRGSVLDGYRPAAESAPIPAGGLRRVVVTFGTQRGFPYPRAAAALARLLPQVTAPDADILWQTGCTDVTSLGIPGRDLVPPADLAAAITDADLVIAHAGVGSALLTLDAGRCPLLLPRRHAHAEHTDDHQTQLATDLATRSLAVSRDPDTLTPTDLLLAAAMRTLPVPWPAAYALQDD
jgi:UDP-N-acetylglucosamine--N-acetylmuramyl-(pentapeptide) pyrophosphoryl-undecaprenol N-acetylglucosamine transferase